MRCRRSLNRRFSKGLLLKAAYTWSKAIDEATYSDWTEFLWNAPSVYDRNRALASHDIPHNFQLGFVYELPFGDGKPYATSGLSRTILGGWQMNGTFSAYSGRPFTLTASGASLNMPGNQQTPDQIKDDVEIFGEVGDAGTYFDTTAFARVTEVRFGNVGRNTMRGPGAAEPRPEPLPHLQPAWNRRSAVPAGGVQRDQHASLQQPERERQQRELRKDPVHRRQLGDGQIPAVPVRIPADVLKQLSAG